LHIREVSGAITLLVFFEWSKEFPAPIQEIADQKEAPKHRQQ